MAAETTMIDWLPAASSGFTRRGAQQATRGKRRRARRRQGIGERTQSGLYRDEIKTKWRPYEHTYVKAYSIDRLSVAYRCMAMIMHVSRTTTLLGNQLTMNGWSASGVCYLQCGVIPNEYDAEDIRYSGGRTSPVSLPLSPSPSPRSLGHPKWRRDGKPGNDTNLNPRKCSLSIRGKCHIVGQVIGSSICLTSTSATRPFILLYA
jgi:hypothetical protein